MKKNLKAPFPWFGGKSKVASLIWARLGDVDNYIEPFYGTGAVLLLRPHTPKIETVNDVDTYISNFWRAVAKNPDKVAYYCNWPVSEVDLHARHRWLVLSGAAKKFRERMRTEPDYFNAKIAGWWCWGLCQWIGAGWCVEPGGSKHGPEGGSGERLPRLFRQVGALSQQAPRLESHGTDGSGIHNSRSFSLGEGNRPQLGDAFSRGRGVHGNDEASACESREAWLKKWFRSLQDRLRAVRTCCGDWKRVCDSPTTLTRLGLTGVFLDPPYGETAGRAKNLYAKDSLTIAKEVQDWCLKYGGERQIRICLAGYAGEHDVLQQHGWKVVAWRSQGGYANKKVKKGEKNENRDKERLWFSPHCQNSQGFFDL